MTLTTQQQTAWRGLAAAVIVVALLLGLAWRSEHALGSNLPPRIECRDEQDATSQALRYIVDHGGSIGTTSGTPSMAPYIVGRAVTVWHHTAFADVPIGTPILYKILPGSVRLDGSSFSPDTVFLHILAARDAAGGIPTGLNTPHYENWGRVTDANFVGVVDRVFTWPQSEVTP